MQLTEHHLEFLSLKGGCTGSSESTHVKMLHCWKSQFHDSNQRKSPEETIDSHQLHSTFLNGKNLHREGEDSTL